MRRWLYGMLVVLVLPAVAQWQRIELPAPYRYGYFLDVFFLPSDPQYGWACGFNGYVVRTTDGGKTWKGTQLPAPANHMESIHFVSPLVGWCSGTNPDRIYRTTDGGRTWTDITPNPTGELWGCYFVNDSVGVLVGGGCGTPQNFYRTTDGGNTWTLKQYHEPGSGLSDVILYSANGLGYAISSGRIWRTTDGGRTWSIFAITGPKHWQEEISKNGNSFLLPSAGNTCNGDGPGGEMGFSPDNGNTWLAYSTGKRMFGSFLLTPRIGWGVGDSGTAIRTTNGGYAWELLNCGVEGINLDDIWFVNDTTAFIAGAGGLYRMVWPPVQPHPDTVQFDTVCIGDKQVEKIWIKNYWGKDYPAYTELIGSSAFTTDLRPTLTVAGCDSMDARIVFEPKRAGKHTAVLRLTTPTVGRSFLIYIEGYALPPTHYQVSRDTLIINPAFCGQNNTGGVTLQPVDTSAFSLQSVERISGSSHIRIASPLPLEITEPGTDLLFQINPPDTGWYEARFRLFVNQCSPDTVIVVRAYGVSPIIVAPQRVQHIAACRDVDTVAVPVRNGGNDTLKISAVTLQGSDTAIVQALFWRSGQTLPVAIPPKAADTLQLVIQVQQNQSYNFSIALANNDRTQVRGNANPKIVAVQISSFQPELELSATQVDFGTVCIDTPKDTAISIQNLSPQSSVLDFIMPATAFQLISPANPPVKLSPNQQINLQLRFAPTELGEFTDTLIVLVQPCNLRFAIVLHGQAITTDVAATPAQIQMTISPGDTTVIPVRLRSTGTAAAVIDTILLTPQRSDWMIVAPVLPQTLQSGEELTVQLKLFPSSDTVYVGKICASGDAECPWSICVDVDISAKNKLLTVQPGMLTLPEFVCSATPVQDTVWITNTGSQSVTLYGASVTAPELEWQFDGGLPFALDPGAAVAFVVRWTPITPRAAIDTLRIFASVDTVAIPVSFGWYRPELEIVKAPASLPDTLFRCEPAQQWQWEVRNSGNFADTVDVQVPDVFAAAVSVTPLSFPLSVNEHRSFGVQLDPTVLEEGIYRIPVVLAWRQCGGQDTVELSVAIRDPRAVFHPANLQVGPVFARKEQVTATVYLVNPSAYFPIEVTDIQWDSPVPAALMLSHPPLPVTVAAADSLPVSIRYAPPVPDTVSTALRATIGPRCDRQSTAGVVVMAVEKVYPLVLSIPAYEAVPGDTIDVAVLARLEGKDAEMQRMEFAVDFLPTIFVPLQVSLGNGYAAVPFTSDLGRTIVTLDSLLLAQSILSFAGSDQDTLITMRGIVQLSDPSVSPLTIADVTIQSPDRFAVTTIDGTLKLQQICLLDLRTIQLASTFSVVRVVHPAPQPAIVINASGPMELQLSVYSVTGVLAAQQTIAVSAGQHSIPLPGTLPSGVYFWELRSPMEMAKGYLWVVR